MMNEVIMMNQVTVNLNMFDLLMKKGFAAIWMALLLFEYSGVGGTTMKNSMFMGKTS